MGCIQAKELCIASTRGADKRKSSIVSIDSWREKSRETMSAMTASSDRRLTPRILNMDSRRSNTIHTHRQGLGTNSIVLHHHHSNTIATTTTSVSHRDVFSIFGPDLIQNKTSAPEQSALLHLASKTPLPPPSLVLHPAPHATYMSLGVSFSSFSSPGIRETNEDAISICYRKLSETLDSCVFGLFDGHGGSFTSGYLAREFAPTCFQYLCQGLNLSTAIVQTCSSLDSALYELGHTCGSTAIGMVRVGSEVGYFSVGDSQIVLSRVGGVAHNVCCVHRPNDPTERRRIELAQGSVIRDRIFGVLSVSRAFGDNDFKTSKGEFQHRFRGDLVSAEPDVVIQRCQDPEDEFVLLGCDGIFDVLTPQQAVTFVRQKLIESGDMDVAAKALCYHATTLGSLDNVTAIVVGLHESLESNIH